MGANSNIEWTDHTWNPWIGCTRVSPGCVNCYAERYGHRFSVEWGPGELRRRTSSRNWREPLTWNREAEAARRRWAQLGAVGAPPARPRVFSASLADWLDHEAPLHWLAEFLTIVRDTGDLDWLLLTKRPALWGERLAAVAAAVEPGLATWVTSWLEGDAPPNVWLGTTVEDQARADERVPILLKIPARVRFLSCEPLLGPVTLDPRWLTSAAWWCPGHKGGVELGEEAWNGSLVPGPDSVPVCPTCRPNVELEAHCNPQVHWLIAGGESDIGDGARPMHPDWARSLRDQAQAAELPYLFKQWGDWVPEGHPAYLRPDPGDDHPDDHATVDLTPGRLSTYVPMHRAGKKAAGRELDGRTWDEFPGEAR